MRIHIVLVSVLLASCSSGSLPKLTPYKVEIRQGNLITQEMRAKLKPGMTQSQVKALLGAPLIADVYHANRWDYYYSLRQGGEVTEKQRLTLYFDKDLLTRIDDVTPLESSDAAKKEVDHGKD
ncbi:outer membrane protein assembly factor BamE [Sideroxyarcus emersonii]|nr:outer membrane protein assembly factor BamE [Sideroxyarcus emersonii]